MYDLNKNRGSVFSLQYHLITTVKYRKKVFVDDGIVSFVKETVSNIADRFDVNILEIECGDDHLHMLLRTKPTLDITKFINILKGHSSREIRKKYKSSIEEKLWGENLWSPSYFLATTGNVTVDILKQYIENQRNSN